VAPILLKAVVECKINGFENRWPSVEKAFIASRYQGTPATT